MITFTDMRHLELFLIIFITIATNNKTTNCTKNFSEISIVSDSKSTALAVTDKWTEKSWNFRNKTTKISRQCIFHNNWCVFYNLKRISRSKSKVKLSSFGRKSTLTPSRQFYSDNNLLVESIKFEESKFAILDVDFCSIFPHLRRLHINNVSLEVITSDSLVSCSSLEDLNLNHNNLSQLPIFEGVSHLQRLSLTYNKIQNVKDITVIFEAKKLENLSLEGNFLEEFLIQKPYSTATQKYLSTLRLRNNKLKWLNTTNIMFHFPNLTQIYLDGNSFNCTSLEDILKGFRSMNVTVAEPVFKVTNDKDQGETEAKQLLEGKYEC